MKVLWLSHVLPWPPVTGVLQRSHNLLRQAAQRHEVHLYALNQRAVLSEPERVEAGVSALSQICERVHVRQILTDGTRGRRALLLARGVWSSSPYEVSWLRSPELNRDLKELAGSEAFDLLHVDTLGMLQYARSFAPAPTVLNHHNVESRMMRRRARRERNPVKRLYIENEARKLENFERSRCPSVDVNLTVSPLDGEGLREIAPGVCVRVVDNGVDVEFFRPTAAPRNGRRGLVFAGGMDWYPNREAMLFFAQKIWPALVEDDPRRTVTIVGREPPPQVLAASRDSRVTVTGFVDDVRPYLDRAAIYVCPIRDGGGTRLKILDALAMAKPLVATALAVEGLDLQEGTHYLRAEKPAEFVEKIRRLERDGGLRDRLARAGRLLVESRFSWDTIGSKLEAAYRLAVEGASGSGPRTSV